MGSEEPGGRDVRFRWFDPGLFADLERTLAGVLRGLGSPTRFMGQA
jgi:hypothetical protein